MKFKIEDLTSMQLMVCLEALGELGEREDREGRPLPTYEVEEMSEDEALAIVSGEKVELDANGEVWDENEHSSSKAVNKDGTWKKKKVFNKNDGPVPPPPVESPVAIVLQPVEATTTAASMGYAEFVKAISDILAKDKSMNDFKVILANHGYSTISELRNQQDTSLFNMMLLELQS